ncbi:MAG: NFACT family protein, partial [Actinomycetota bacterium]
QLFVQLRHQLIQKLAHILAKLRIKAQSFSDRLQQSDQAEEYRQKADLLMANLHQWQLGMQNIILPDFETERPIIIAVQQPHGRVLTFDAVCKAFGHFEQRFSLRFRKPKNSVFMD